jgi:hypothetical protein
MVRTCSSAEPSSIEDLGKRRRSSGSQSAELVESAELLVPASDAPSLSLREKLSESES